MKYFMRFLLTVTSVHHQYAVEGFALNVTDYLLKPFDFERFLAAINKVKASHPQIQTVLNEDGKKIIFFSTSKNGKLKYSLLIYSILKARENMSKL